MRENHFSKLFGEFIILVVWIYGIYWCFQNDKEHIGFALIGLGLVAVVFLR